MLSDNQKTAIRAELGRLKLGRGPLAFKPDTKQFMVAIERLTSRDIQFHGKFRQSLVDYGWTHTKCLEKRFFRERLAYNIAFAFWLLDFPPPRPSDDTPYNCICGICFDAIGLPVNGKQRRDLLRRILTGIPEVNIPPPYPAP